MAKAPAASAGSGVDWIGHSGAAVTAAPHAAAPSRLRAARPRAPNALAKGALLVGAVAVDVAATTLLARAMGTSSDLFPRWLGTREWLLHGVSPYGDSVSETIRAAMGGVPGGGGGAFVFGFVYPGYVALLLAPLALLPFRTALTVWLLGVQLAVGAGAFLARIALVGERRGAWLSPALFLAAAVLFPASIYNLFFGQFAAFTFVALAGSWLLLVRRRDGWAGVALAAALVKPSLALLPALSLLAWALANRRWRCGVAWLLVTLALTGMSVAALPEWPAAFWRSTADYASAASAINAASLLGDVVTGSALRGAPLAVTTVIAVVVAALVALGWRARRREVGAALAAGVLLGAWLVPPLYEWNSVLLLLPIGQAFGALPRPRMTLALALLVAASLASLGLLLHWPSESRVLWPAIATLLWVVVQLSTGHSRGAK